jgi:hypothetical protein
MISDAYRQSAQFRADAIRQAELNRLANAARGNRRTFWLFRVIGSR